MPVTPKPLNITNAQRDTGVLNRNARSTYESIHEVQNELKKIRQDAATVKAKVNTTTANSALAANTSGVSISENGYIIDGVLYSELTCTYTAPSPLGTFAGVFLVVKNYRGSADLVKVTENSYTGSAGGTGHFKVTLQRTNETITCYFVSKNAQGGSASDWTTSPSTTVVLDGNASAPNAPTGVVATAQQLGVALSWTENTENNLKAYNVYRNTSNNSGTATNIATVGASGLGSAAYFDKTAVAGTTYWYWITAVNTAKQESVVSSAVNTAGLTVSLDNDVADGTTYGRPLRSRLSSGKPLIDFSESIHLNKNLDNLADGGTYGRALLSRLSSGKPWIDFSEAIHSNKNLDNISDGSVYPRNAGQYGANILENPSFETPALAGSGDIVAGWYEILQSGILHTSVQNATYAKSGNACLEPNISGSQVLAAGASMSLYLSPRKLTPAVPGQTYVLKVWANPTISGLPAGVTVNIQSQVRQLYSDGSGDFSAGLSSAVLSTNTGYTQLICGPAALPSPVGKTLVNLRVELTIIVTNTSGSPVTIDGSTMNAGVFWDSVELLRVSSLDNEVADGSTYVRPSYVNPDHTFHVSSVLLPQGSIANIGPNTFSYTSTTTSITWSWTAFSVYAPDGTVYNFSSGSQNFTGLSASTTYHFGFYCTLNGLVVHVAMSTQSSGHAAESVQIQAQTYNGDGNVCINPDATASTPSSGSGGGSGGGACFSGDTKVKTPSGFVRFDELPKECEIINLTGRHKAQLIVHEASIEPMVIMPNGALATKNHLMLHPSGGWQPASAFFSEEASASPRTVYNMHVVTDDPDDMHYILETGHIAHNIKKFGCFNGATKVKTSGGLFRFDELPEEFTITDPQGRLFQAKLIRHYGHREQMFLMPDGSKVTGVHLVRRQGEKSWHFAGSVFPKCAGHPGILYNLRIEGSDHYVLENGFEAHDMKGMHGTDILL